MPDGLGATPEEIAEYEKTLKAAQKALGTMKSSPFVRANFDKAIADLETALLRQNSLIRHPSSAPRLGLKIRCRSMFPLPDTT